MKNNGYLTGLVSVSFRQHTPREIMEAMKETDLSCIEWGSDIHAPYNDINKLKEISLLQKEYNISCSSYGTYFRFGETPIEELEGYINAAKILGTDTLRLWCLNKSGDEMSDREKEELVSLCTIASETAKKNSVVLCLECHKNTFTENPSDSIYLMERVNSPSFRMYWQPFQWQNEEQNIKNASLIAPYTKHIHVFNWVNNEKFPLGDGVDKWRKYLKPFSKDNALLLEFMPKDSLDELKEEAKALKIITEE